MSTEGRPVQGVAADGVARVLVRIPASAPGQQFTVRLLNDAEPHATSTSDEEDGEISSILTQANGSNLVVTNAESTGAGDFAFVVYRSPEDFPRAGGQDESKEKRQVFLEIQAQGELPYTQVVDIIRPPVMLVHGIWSGPKSWSVFSPLATGVDPRFVTERMDYSSPVDVLETVPTFAADKLERLKANSLGLAFNATALDDQLGIMLNRVRGGSNPAGIPVAAVQSDVVGHSMGGLVARTLSASPAYSSPETFGDGRINKLVTIDSPHLGTPIAPRLLAIENRCLRELIATQLRFLRLTLFRSDNFSIASATLLDGRTVSGAIGDFVDLPASLALQNLTSSTKSLPVAYIAGRYDKWPSLDTPAILLGRAAILRVFCGSSPLANSLTSTGWQAMFGGPSDGIVSRNSQINGIDDNAVSDAFDVVHSDGAQDLGFEPPDVLSPGSVPVDVIRLLNQPLYSPTSYRATPQVIP